MAHKLGEAKPLVSGKKIFYLGGLAAIVLLASIFIFGKGRGWLERKLASGRTVTDSRHSFEADQSIMPPVNLLPVSKEPPVRFNEGRQIVLPLRNDEWSREVVLPIHPTKYVDWRVDVEPATGYFVKYKDGKTEWVRADQKEYDDHGIRRGIFRIVGTSPGQQATISISFRSASD